MKEIIATTETYPGLIAEGGIALIMYDIRREPYRSKPRIMAAFRRMGRKYEWLRLVYVDFQFCRIPDRENLGHIPSFRLYCDGQLIEQVRSYMNGDRLERWIDSLLGPRPQSGIREAAGTDCL